MGEDITRKTPNRAGRTLLRAARELQAKFTEFNGEARRRAVKDLEEFERALAERHAGLPRAATAAPPAHAEKLLLLLLTREERATNIVGDLAEEYAVIAAKHGIRFANVWYGKQVAASAWPLLIKALRLGFVVSTWDWVRRLM